MIVWSHGFISTPHRHPALQLIMTLRGPLLIRAGPQERWKQCGAALVRSNAVHEVDARGTVESATVLLAYVHPESELGAALGALLANDIECLSPSVVARWRGAVGWPVRGNRVERWVSRHLLNGHHSAPLDARVERVLTYVRSNIGRSVDLSLPALAMIAGLSPSRFLHVFTQNLGVPPRPYIRWLRLQRAACELIEGGNVSRAAHRAGFSDAAHLNRTFRRMLGMTPSEIASQVRMSSGLSSF
jgi:AraC-like DNA-binding protein